MASALEAKFKNIASELETKYVTNAVDPWHGSPFAWILKQPARTKGAIGEKLVEEWYRANEIDVQRSPDSEADRIVNGVRMEIKMSTLWSSGGYKFQQIREQNYDYCFCLGLSPSKVHAWLLPKSTLRKNVIGVTGQHTGANGADTAWIGFQADQPHDWMKPYGGTLDAVLELTRKM